MKNEYSNLQSICNCLGNEELIVANFCELISLEKKDEMTSCSSLKHKSSGTMT